MRMRFSSASASSTKSAEGAAADLLVLLVRLIRHRGYSRDSIVSARLKRCFPEARILGSSAEAALRIQFATMNIDAKSIIYLIDNAIMELHMAHERSVG